ncbi:MAG: hypothetical protein HFJ36_02375 [Clostridia bacterium]|nr:hypothetical protein [Clostridia bacterium]
MKDIKKYLLGILATSIVVFIVSKYIPKNNSMLGCLKQTVPTITNINRTDEQRNYEEDFLQGILKTQISSMKVIENMENNMDSNIENEDVKENKVEEEQKQNIEMAQTNLETEVVTNNPIAEKYQAEYGKVKIKNETEFELTQDILKPDITIENKNVVLFHTHSCESYTSSEKYPYTPTGTYRTTDLNYTVTRVGTELENQLKQYNYNVVHSTSYHDYPAYNGSYTRSLETVENILKTTPSDIVIDVHRDAIGSRSDYAPIVKIGENDVAAQIMFVIRNK